jgi:hypothetical protein
MNYVVENWSTRILDPEFISEINALIEKGPTLDFNPPTEEEMKASINGERNHILWHYAKLASNLPGDFVEVGTFMGESAFFMARQCKTNMHVFDSWQGSVDVSEYDGEFYKDHQFLCEVTAAQKTLDGLNVNFHFGPVPFELDTLGDISLLHIDVNLYAPTKATLEALWDKVVPGGYVLVDTHDNVSEGTTKAVVDFFVAIKEMTMLPTGKILVIK